jgi:carbonic anhydrase
MNSQAIKKLLDGNHRYAANRLSLDVSEFRRTKISHQQKPFAAVLSCSDSRVPPELVFDQGLGELFVVRTAGTVPDESVIASLELGIREFQIPVLMVLGHSRCGAVKHAIDTLDKPPDPEREMPYLVRQLKPSVEKVEKNSRERWDGATRLHTLSVVERLKQSPVLNKAIQAAGLEILMGWYDLDTGKADIITAPS